MKLAKAARYLLLAHQVASALENTIQMKPLEELLSNVDVNDVEAVTDFFTENNFFGFDEKEGIETADKDCTSFFFRDKLRDAIHNSNGTTINVCKGVTLFSDPIELDDMDVNLRCSGIPGSCIFYGKGKTQLFNGKDLNSNITFDGFSFVKGYTDTSEIEGNELFVLGGAININNKGNTTFTRNLFLYNTVERTQLFERRRLGSGSTFPEVQEIDGGALYLYEGHNVIDSCLFLNNMAIAKKGTNETLKMSSFGGALGVETAVLDIMDSKFMSNSAKMTTVNGATSDGTESAAGGSIFIVQSEVGISGSHFVDNLADSVGDGSGGSITVIDSLLSLEDSKFISNEVRAAGPGYGGAVDAVDVGLNITKSLFSDNKVFGKEFGLGGSLSAEDADVVVTESKFNNNYADTAGGVAAVGDDVSLLWQGNSALVPSFAEGECYGVATVDFETLKIDSCQLANVYISTSP